MIAEPQFTPDRYERALAAIHTLIEARDIGRHAIFDEVGEGTAFPDGTESMSGHVVDEQERVFFFWTGWDAERGRPVFITWAEVTPESRWLTNGEYLDARAAVGLAAPAAPQNNPFVSTFRDARAAVAPYDSSMAAGALVGAVAGGAIGFVVGASPGTGATAGAVFGAAAGAVLTRWRHP